MIKLEKSIQEKFVKMESETDEIIIKAEKIEDYSEISDVFKGKNKMMELIQEESMRRISGRSGNYLNNFKLEKQ